MQPAKPSFLEYFEQKEKEANIHNKAGENHADHRKLPAEGELEVVSLHPDPRLCLCGNLSFNVKYGILSFAVGTE